MSIAALTILGPLAAAGLIASFRRASEPLALLGAVVSAIAALGTLLQVAGGAQYSTLLPGLPELPLRLVVDPLAAVLSVVVAVVSFFVLLYAVEYMRGERSRARFYAEMSFFAAAMQALVFAGDWVLFLAAWELIGLASYLLIGYYYERPGVPAAASRAFLTTRSADLGLYLGVLLLVSRAGTTEIAATLNAGGTAATVAGLLLLLAAAGKSAQAPFQGWLADAMVGPTPVSALLHSATLVAAGVALLARAFPLLPSGVLLLVGTVGGVTAVLAGVTALAQRDLKRLLAASTSSQLGFMFLALGAGSVVAAVFHLVTHAAMKSALFLGAGIFQHDRHGTDFEDLAGSGRGRRLAFAGFTLSGLALAGVPPLAGYRSKDAVVAAALGSEYAAVLVPLALVGTLLTGAYVARALRLLWRGEERVGRAEGLGPMGAGLAGLALLAALLGLAADPLSHLLDRELPEGLLAAVLSLLAALTGLTAGWLFSTDRLLGPVRAPAEVNFRAGGGFAAHAARPVISAAHVIDGLDRRIHSGALTAGRGVRAVASAVWAADEFLLSAVRGAGSLGLVLAGASRRADERGIDVLIAGLVRRTRRLGGRARRLQTGLVHRELALAAGGVAALLVLVFVVTLSLR